MAFFRLVPNLTIMAPKDFKEFEDMLESAVNLKRPVVIRYPRGGEDTKIKFQKHDKIKLGKAEIIKEGKEISIIAIGKTVARAMEVSNMLEKNKISAEVINARFLKPLDKEIIKNSINKTKFVITIEDGTIINGLGTGTIINGLGTAIKELIVNEKLKEVEIKSYAYPDEFIKHGEVSELEKLYHQDSKLIYEEIVKMKKKNKKIERRK